MDEILIKDGADVLSRIVFGRSLHEVPAVLQGCAGSSTIPVYVVSDANVGVCADMVASAIADSDRLEFCGEYLIEASETRKTMETVLAIDGWLLENGADRNALLLAIGGGITTDMAGFAASIYKRGIRFAFIPTTLLAQVDAAIGGKTGVNFDSYKNMLGVIRQPEFTFICPSVLGTLPCRDFLSGAAELVKSFIIKDNGEYARAISFLSGMAGAGDRKSYVRRHGDELLGLVRAAASVKAGIVSRDQFEHGERRKLNLGHTFAHAIEKTAREKGDDITHGEAVSAGIVLAAELSVRIGLAEPDLAGIIAGDLASAGLRTCCPYRPDELAEAMTKDKKSEDGIIHFVLISSVGNVCIRDMGAAEAIKELL